MKKVEKKTRRRKPSAGICRVTLDYDEIVVKQAGGPECTPDTTLFCYGGTKFIETYCMDTPEEIRKTKLRILRHSLRDHIDYIHFLMEEINKLETQE